MKKLIFFILIIPLLLSSWTGTWDKGYIVEERIDTLSMIQLPWTRVTNCSEGVNIYSSRTEYNPYLTASNQRFVTPLFKLLFNGNDSIYVDSLVLVYHLGPAFNDTDTVVFRIDTVHVVTNGYRDRYYVYKETLITNQSEGQHRIAITDIGMNKQWAFNHPIVTLWYKKAESSPPFCYLFGFIIYYKVYYKVR